jgi:site-specific recombinase XerD
VSTDLALPQAPGQLAERVHLYAVGANARNTLRAYQADLRDYTAWCDLQGVQALPALPLTVAAYLTSLADAGAAVATIERRMAALSQAHQAIGTTPPPTSDWNVRQVMKGIRRRLAGAPAQRRELLGPELRRLCETLPDGRLGLRDRALLLMGHLGALRRSELVALNVEDVEVTDDGLVVSLRRSKTDQEGEGAVVGIPRRRRDPEVCPVRALRAWLEDAGHTSGPLWRPVNRWGQVAPRRITDKTVARIVKRSCVRAGLDPARYSAHSLRSGFATEASRGGATEQEIMTHGRWRSVEVARRYIRRGTLFNRNPADAVAL